MLGQGAAVDQFLMYALPLGGSTLLAYGVFQALNDLRRSDTRRVEQRLQSAAATAARNEQLARESILRHRAIANSAITAALAKLRFVPRLQRALDQANLRWIATGLLVNLVGVGALVYLALYALQFDAWMCALAAALAMGLPLAFVHIKRQMRIGRFLNQLPDVFDLMSQGLRAGHSLPAAIHLVSQQVPDPVGTEFARVFYEQNLGLKIEDAMLNMAERVGLMDVRLFVTAVLIQRTTGGDLAELLDNIAGVIRERIKLFGTVKALTAEGRLSGYVLFALPFAVFALEQVINPAYGRILLDNPIGHYMLAGALTMQLLGLLLIRKIVNIKA